MNFHFGFLHVILPDVIAQQAGVPELLRAVTAVVRFVFVVHSFDVDIWKDSGSLMN